MEAPVHPLALAAFATLLCVVPGQIVRAEDAAAQGGWRPLFNGKDFSGWKLRNPDAKKTWVVYDEVQIDPADPARLLPVGQGGGGRCRHPLQRRRPRFGPHDGREPRGL